jgi:hypothetical protein
MGQAISRQHPAVVLRSRHNLARALLACAMVAVVALTIAVVVLASDGEKVGDASAARPIESIRYGGFNPATGRPESAPLPQTTPLPQRKLDGATDVPRRDGGYYRAQSRRAAHR